MKNEILNPVCWMGGSLILNQRRMKKSIVIIGVVLGIIGWSCQKVENPPRGLKLSIEQASADVNNAFIDISSTRGYEVLTANGGPVSKSGTSFSDSISLAMVAGIYDFQPDTLRYEHHNMYPFRLFNKTGESDHLIVNFPQKMAFHCDYLHRYNPADTLLKNDFSIDASDYHLYYNWWNSLDYKLSADLSLDSESLGNMNVSAVSGSFRDQSYSSAFTFSDGYSISTSWQTGDTAVSAFALTNSTDTLLRESTSFTGTGFHRHEKQYTLSIGNIEIKRGYGIDSIQVYMDGVLQKTAGAKITDTSDTTGSICNKRDILLTFDDGTTAKLSDLIGPALTELRTLVTSLHDMYFAEKVVNYVAINIYYNNRQ
jgi:hypothetical protein